MWCIYRQTHITTHSAEQTFEYRSVSKVLNLNYSWWKTAELWGQYAPPYIRCWCEHTKLFPPQQEKALKRKLNHKRLSLELE